MSNILERFVSRHLISCLTINSIFFFKVDFANGILQKQHYKKSLISTMIPFGMIRILHKNTINHAWHIQCVRYARAILLSRLHPLRIRYIAISWFISLIYDHSSSNNIYNYLFPTSPVKYGVPRGSVLIPSFLSVYLYPLPSIISKYPNIYYHL